MDKPEIRRNFPVTSHCVYFNHAAVGPLPQSTYEAMEAHARQQRDRGAMDWREWIAQYGRLRRQAARLIGAQPQDISILKNTTEGLSFVAEGVRYHDGDNVVTTDMEFPSNYACWKRLERKGVDCRPVTTRNGVFTLADVEAVIDERTRVLSVSSVSFHNGFRPDLEALGELCAARGILFCVDAIQSLGALQLDVRRAKISFLAADGHKWMLGPEGTAIFYSSPEARQQLEVLESGWMNIDRGGMFIGASTDLLTDGRRFEGGSLNTNGAYGLEASLRFLEETGAAEIEAEVMRLATRLADALEELGFHLRSPRPLQSGIVAVTPPELDLDRLRHEVQDLPPEMVAVAKPMPLLHLWLEMHKVICAPREGMIRFSPHFYNDDSEIAQVVELLERIV